MSFRAQRRIQAVDLIIFATALLPGSFGKPSDANGSQTSPLFPVSATISDVIDVNNLRQNVLFEQEGSIYQVLEFYRHKMARQKGMVNVKVRNIETGSVTELSFRSGDSVNDADVERTTLQFVYADDRKQVVVLSNPENKKRLELSFANVPEEQRKYMVNGIDLVALMNESGDKVYSIELPNTVELKVTQAPPAEKGNTAGSGGKPVTVETGAVISTPFFIKAGDVIKVNTLTGEYIERVGS